jgi:hypothetical protein
MNIGNFLHVGDFGNADRFSLFDLCFTLIA